MMRNMCQVSPQHRKRKWIFRGLFALYALIVIGGGLWLYGWMMIPPGDDSLGDKAVVWNYYYPELRQSGVLDVQTVPPGDLKVLLLGASVLEQVAPALTSQLEEEFGGRVRVYNLAKSAHTTQDSVLKYRLLDPQDFDLVIVYHGINDARMNYCPPEAFREDYTHISWYHAMQQQLAAGSMTVKDVYQKKLQVVFPLGEPDREEWPYGADIKTRKSFRNHIEELVSRSESAKTPILLMTFAWWLPEYDPDASNTEGAAAYGTGDYGLSADSWGDPQYLPQILKAHNEVIRDVSEHSQTLFVDEQHLIPKDGRYFTDPCHLTNAGKLLFVENLWPVVKQTLESAE